MKTLFKLLISSIAISAIAATGFAQTEVSGTITTYTWTQAGSPYIVIGDVLISSGGTLTIEPGVEVKFDGHYDLEVDGTLIADGTSSDNITFTSNEVSPQPGDWEKIQLNDGSTGIFDHCVIAYGGGYSWYQFGAVELMSASPTISNCTISNNTYGIKCGGGSNPTISDNNFSGNTHTPILISLLANPVFSGNSFSGNGYKALGIVGEDVNSSCTLGKRTVAGIENIVYVLMDELTIVSGITLTIEPGVVIKLHNMDSDILVDGTLNAEGTADSVIVFTSTKDDAHGGDTNNNGSATSPDAGDWEKIKFKDGSAGILDYCVIAYGGGYDWDQFGAVELMSASPTISNCMIWFNTYGISCNKGLNPAISDNNFQHNTHTPVLISLLADPVFSGNTFSSNGYKALGIIGEDVNSSCTLGKRTVAGIENIVYVLMDELTIVSGITLTIEPGVVIKLHNMDSDILVDGTLNAEGTADSMIVFTSTKDDAHGGDTNNNGSATSPDANDWEKIQLNGGSTGIFDYCVITYGGGYNWDQFGAVELVSASPTISNCTISNNTYGIKCSSGSNPTISDNNFSGNTHTLILISLLANPSFSGNTFSSNGYKALGIVGEDVNSSCTLGKRTVAGIENITYVLMDDLTIGLWATVTIEPGVVIKLHNMDSDILVDGTLNAEGTADSMIVFTSTKDDAHGGDTNNDSSATPPDANDWEKIQFNAGSAGIFDHCVIAYGGGYSWDKIGAIELVNASPTISNCVIVNNRYGIICYGTANPPIHYNDICGNIEYGIYNADSAVTIDATNNWWGDASGPYDPSDGSPDHNPDGKGDKVSDYVSYRPWRNQTIVGIEEDTPKYIAVPEVYSLLQNYPNPFNPTTTISYKLPKSELVKLTIYDINGRLVEILVNEKKNAGYYTVVWNAEQVSSGIYFYRINAGEYSSVKKCLVIK